MCGPKIEQAETEAAAREQATLLLERAGGSARMRGWSFQTYPDDEPGRQAKASAARWFEAWLTGSTANLLLFGPIGTGKSGLAWCLIRAACEQGHDALFANWRDHLWDLRQSFGDPSWQVDRHAHFVNLLALDDLGAERPTDFARDELASLVEHRLTKGRATIMTSNYDPAELARRLGHNDLTVGQRIVSRLCEGAVQVRLEGADRRVATTPG